MGYENFVLKSWLPQAGTVERVIILKKLKRSLEKRGLTRQEVYEGLLQLAKTPRVLVTRCCIRHNLRSRTDDGVRVANITKPVSRISSTEVAKRDKISKDISIVNGDKETATVILEKLSTPELIDDEIGTGSPYWMIPRKTIKLNMKGYGSTNMQAPDKCYLRSSTEISIADSSVIDDEDEKSIRGKGIANSVGSSKDTGRTKPKIIEDVTYLEGTVFSGTVINLKNTLSKSPGVIQLDEPTPDGNDDCTVIVNRSISSPKAKKRRMAVFFSGKKLRLRRTFRQIFGNDLTFSELEEEDDIIDRFVRKRRKKRARPSMDSGVSLTDTNDILVEQRDRSPDLVEFREYDGKLNPAELPTCLMVAKETNVISETSSMAESQSRVTSSREITPTESLPDSSTNSVEEVIGVKSNEEIISVESNEEIISVKSNEDVISDKTIEDVKTVKSETDDTSIDRKSPKATEKVTIVVSPVNAGSPDAFEPVSFEIEMPCNGKNAVRVSTPITSTESKQCTRSETITVGHAETGNSSADSAGVTVTIEREDPNRSENTTISLANDTSRMTSINENGDGSIIGKETTRVEVVANPLVINDHGTNDADSTFVSSVPTLPKLRVLRPSELGSRWCPTPLNVPSSDNIPHRSIVGGNFQAMYVPNGSLLPPSSLSSMPSFSYNLERSPMSSTRQPMQETSFPPPAPPISTPKLSALDSGLFPLAIILIMKLDSCINRYKLLHLRYDTSALEMEFVKRRKELGRTLSGLDLFLKTSDVRKVIEAVMRFYDHAVPPEQRLYTTTKVWNILKIAQLRDSIPRPSVQNSYCNIPISAPSNYPPHLPPAYPAAQNFDFQPPVYSAAPPITNSGIAGQRPSSGTNRPAQSIFNARQLAILERQINTYLILRNMPLPKDTASPTQKPIMVPQREPMMVPQVDPLISRQQTTTSNEQTSARRKRTKQKPKVAVPSMESSLLAQPPSEGSPVPRGDSRIILNSPVIRQPECDADRTFLNVDAEDTPRLRSEEIPAPIEASRIISNPSVIRQPEYDASRTFLNVVAQDTPCRWSGKIPAPIEASKIISNPPVNLQPGNGNRNISKAFLNVTAMDGPSACPPSEEIPSPMDVAGIPNLSMNHQPEPVSSESPANSGDSSVDYQQPNFQSSISVSVADVLQTFAMLDSPTIRHDNGNTKNDCRNDEITKSRAETRSGDLSLSPIGDTPTTETVEGTRETSDNVESTINETSTNVDNGMNETNSILETVTSETSANVETDVNKTSPYDVVVTSDETAARIMTPFSDSQSSVLIIDDDAEASCDITPNFSILDVKSITKDLFNNMEQMSTTTPAIQYSSADINENTDDSTVNSWSTGCLRCGKPCCVVCEQCYAAFYCSTECHEAHWSEHHYRSCKPVPVEALAQLQSGVALPEDNCFPYD